MKKCSNQNKVCYLVKYWLLLLIADILYAYSFNSFFGPGRYSQRKADFLEVSIFKRKLDLGDPHMKRPFYTIFLTLQVRLLEVSMTMSLQKRYQRLGSVGTSELSVVSYSLGYLITEFIQLEYSFLMISLTNFEKFYTDRVFHQN